MARINPYLYAIDSVYHTYFSQNDSRKGGEDAIADDIHLIFVSSVS